MPSVAYPAPVPRPALSGAILSFVAGRLSAALLFALLGLFAFIKLAHEVRENETQQFDIAAVGYFQHHQTTLFHSLLFGVSWFAGPYGQSLTVTLGVVGFLIARRFFPEGLSLLVAGVGGIFVVSGLKHLFHRPRPEQIFDVLGYSFPSGHSFFAVVVYGFFAYVLTRDMTGWRKYMTWVACMIAVLLVGFSRVFLGEHYPSDVVAGFAVGLPWLWGCLALPMLLHRKGRDLSPEEATDSAGGHAMPPIA